MEVKTSTKEKYHVITVSAAVLTANLTEDLCNRLITYLDTDTKNIVLNLNNVLMDEEAAERVVKTQQQFYESGASFVICELSPALQNFLDGQNLLELMNVTPTESEAGDIVQMEEIERELFDE